jgi:hypothetical protein
MADKLVKRNITPEEQNKIDIGLERWYPEIIKSNITPVYNLLANPVKRTLITVIVLVIIGFGVYKYFDIKLTSMYQIIAVCSILFIVGSTYITSVRTNGDIIGIIPYLPENATYYDYKQKLPILDVLLKSQGGSDSGLFGLLGLISSSNNSSNNSIKRKRRK